MAELSEVLAWLCAADLPPWRGITAAMHIDYRAMWFLKSADPEWQNSLRRCGRK